MSFLKTPKQPLRASRLMKRHSGSTSGYAAQGCVTRVSNILKTIISAFLGSRLTDLRQMLLPGFQQRLWLSKTHRHATHIRQVVGNALVALDAGCFAARQQG